jgi:hypothetical protein
MFKLSQRSENMKDQAATRTSGVDGFRKGFEANPPVMEILNKLHQVFQRARQTIKLAPVDRRV